MRMRTRTKTPHSSGLQIISYNCKYPLAMDYNTLFLNLYGFLNRNYVKTIQYGIVLENTRTKRNLMFGASSVANFNIY